MTVVANDDYAAAWRRVDLTGDPHLILGRRRGRGIEAVRLDVHEDLFDDMRAVCIAAIDQILNTTPRRYEPYAELEREEEHFVLAMEELPGRDDGSGGAALIETLENPGQLPVIDREYYMRFNPIFYAVAMQQPGLEWVSFVRKTNPRQYFKAGRRWCQYADVLKRVANEPTFVFDEQIDVIVRPGSLIAFSVSPLRMLFTDVGLVQSDVPRYVAAASDLIREEVSLSERSADSLNALGKRKVSVASRLFGLAARIAELKEHGVLTSDRYREIVQEDERALSLLDEDGAFDFDEEGAEVFLDVIEGRYFEDDWTGSPRRADRFSRRL